MLVLALLSNLCSWFQFMMMMAQSTENDPGQNWMCGWKLCVKILITLCFWCFVRTKSLFSVIVGFSFWSLLFFRFRDIFSTVFPHLPKFPSRGGVSVHQLNKPRRTTETSFVAKKSVETFGHHGFFFANISKLGNLPTAFLDFEDSELIPFPSIETPSDVGCHSSFLLTILIFFGCRKVLVAVHVAKELLEKLYFPGRKWYFHLRFRAHADWIVYQNNLFEILRIRSFDILPNRFGILRLFDAKSFAVSWEFLWPFEILFFKRVYLRAYKEYRYNWSPNQGASQGEKFWWNMLSKLSGAHCFSPKCFSNYVSFRLISELLHLKSVSGRACSAWSTN